MDDEMVGCSVGKMVDHWGKSLAALMGYLTGIPMDLKMV